jgi:hypothetical protein
MTASYQTGEIIQVALQGSIYRHAVGDDLTVAELTITVETEHGLFDVTVPLPAPTSTSERKPVTVRRLAPADGPPQPGDVWQDADGGRWFAVRHTDRYDNVEVLLTRDGRETCTVADVHQQHVLVRRLYRVEQPEQATDGGR